MKTVNNIYQRIIWMVIGVIVVAVGVALVTKASLGTSAISSVPLVLSSVFPLTFGTTTFIINIINILSQWIMLREAFQQIQWLQIIVSMVFSVFLDINMWLLGAITPFSLISRLILLIIGCAILALGVAIELAPNVVCAPNEMIVNVIAKVSKQPFGKVKVIFDVSLIIVALTISILAFGRLEGIGLGTVIAAIIVGPLISMWNRLPLITYIQKLPYSDRVTDTDEIIDLD